MADLNDIVIYTDQYLNVDSIHDYCPQGLQVEGGREIKKIVSGVSACMPLFEAAVEQNAQAVLVHHGMFWDSDPRAMRGSQKVRVKYLFDHNLSLIAYHLPLDLHEEVGNNIGLVRAMGLIDPAPFGNYKGTSLGYMARYPDPLPISEVMSKIVKHINPDARSYLFGPDQISRIAILSGGAPEPLREAIARGADLYLTGEESEWIYHLAREESMHYVAAGHHATERFGVMALGERLAKRFDIDVEFIDIPNPI